MDRQCPHCGFSAEIADAVTGEQKCPGCGKTFAAAAPALPKLTVPKLNLKKIQLNGTGNAQAAPKAPLRLKTSPTPLAPNAPAVPKAPVVPKRVNMPTLRTVPGVEGSQEKAPAKPNPLAAQSLQLMQTQAAPRPAQRPAPQAEQQPVPKANGYLEFDTDVDTGEDGPAVSWGCFRVCKVVRIIMAVIVGLTIFCTSGFVVKKLYDRINLVLHKEKRKEKQRLFFAEMFAKDENFQYHAGQLGIQFEKFDEEKEVDPNYFSNLSKRLILCRCSAGGYVAIEAEVQLQFLNSGVKISDDAWRKAERDMKELFAIRERINAMNIGKCIRVEGINWKESTVHRNKQTYIIHHSTGEAVFLEDGREKVIPFKVERGGVPQFLAELPGMQEPPEVKPEESLQDKIIKRIPRSRSITLDEDDGGQAEQ